MLGLGGAISSKECMGLGVTICSNDSPKDVWTLGSQPKKPV
jgi:hypothetical protein